MSAADSINRHFTSTTYIIWNNCILLIEHKKTNTWLPPGGHVELNELPHEAALREIKEEAGIEVTLITDKNFERQNRTLASIDERAELAPRPWKILLERIQENHYHIDFIYLAKAETDKVKTKEGHLLKWFSEQEIKMQPNIFPNVKYFAIKARKQARKQT